MPFDDAFDEQPIELGMSGVVELHWTIGSLTFGPPDGKPARMAVGDTSVPFPELAAEVRGFWDDGGTACADAVDLIVLAQRAGCLLGDAVGAPLVERLLAVADVPPPDDIGLRSEVDGDRAAVRSRLARLAADPALRGRYGDLLVRAWEAISAQAWREHGAAQVAAALGVWRGRLQRTGDLAPSLPAHHVLRRPRHVPQLERAIAEGDRVHFAPTYIGGTYSSYYQLPGALVVTVGVDGARGREERRTQAEAIAARLKPLSDATRLLLLAELARSPLSVSELADALDVSQPTVSVHLQKLRDAGFVQARREGGRTVHRFVAADAEGVLDDVRGALRDLCADA